MIPVFLTQYNNICLMIFCRYVLYYHFKQFIHLDFQAKRKIVRYFSYCTYRRKTFLSVSHLKIIIEVIIIFYNIKKLE